MFLQRHKNNNSHTTYHPSIDARTETEQTGRRERSPLVLRIGAQLDPGIRRMHRPNEDTIFTMPGVIPSASAAVAPKPFVLLVVADGMGGQGHGQEASQLAVRTLVEYVSASLCSGQGTSSDLLAVLSTGVQYANRAVYERNQEQKTVMGTTMTAALVSETSLYIAHVGDSRLYLYRAPIGLTPITHDHSMVAMLVENGVIAPEDIYTHPKRNLIYRCLGDEATVDVDSFALPLAANDILLLCSDGLWEMVHDQQIAHILAAPIPAPLEKAHELIQAALAGGGDDNISAIVAQVSEAPTQESRSYLPEGDKNIPAPLHA